MGSSTIVGIVGTGAITQQVHLPVLCNIPTVKVAWIADRDGALARSVAGGFGLPWHELPADPQDLPACDLAFVATPVNTREPYLRAFARSGTAVFVEKPFALTADEHAAYLHLFERVPIACGHMRRTYASMRTLRRFVQSGWFGTLRSIRYREGGRVTATESTSATLNLSYRFGGGVLRDLGCHGIDLIHFITGAADFTIEACRMELDQDTDRHVQARFSAQGIGGVTGASCPVDFTLSWLLDQPNTIELEFERAAVRCGLKPTAVPCVASDMTFRDAVRLQLDEIGARTEYQSYFLEWDDVLTAHAHKVESGFAASRFTWTTRLIEQLYRRGVAQ